jgi:Nuclease-related domain
VSVSACPGPNSRFKRLRYGGICISCGSKIEPEETGWHDPDVKKVTCKECWGEHDPLIQSETKTACDVVGGSSTLKWSEQGHRRNRRKGAAGEYVMDRHLHRELQSGEIILNDCQIPNGRGNIDHIVVASSGVWVIDTKYWAGRIEYKSVGGMTGINDRLLVDGEDRTHRVDEIYAQVIPIASLIGDR